MGNRFEFIAGIGLTAAALALAGCGGGGGGGSGGGAPQPATFSLGGTVTGLAGSAVVLRNGTTDLTVSNNGTFTFTGALPNGTAYNVVVATQPANPPRSCAITNGSGTVNGANVTNISVACTVASLTVASSTPQAGATGHPRGDGVFVTFSAPLDISTVTGSNITLSSAAGPEDIQLAVVGEQLRVIPNSRLRAATHYTLNIPADLRGTGGEALGSAVSLSFDTAVRSWRGEGSVPGVSTNPKVAVGHGRAADGDTLLVWSDQQLLPAAGADPERLVSSHWFSRYTAGAGWSTPELLGTDTWNNPDPNANTGTLIRIGASQNGELFAVHFTGDRARLIAHRFVPGSGWQTAQTIETAAAGALDGAPAIAADADGNAIAVWTRFDGTWFNAWAANFAAAGSWSAPRLLDAAAAGDAQRPQAAFDAAGNAHVVWHNFDAADSTMQDQDLWAARYQRSGGWSAAQAIAPATISNATPALQVDAAGNALVIFVQGLQPTAPATAERMWSVRYSGSAWGTAAPLPGAQPFIDLPELALDSGLDGFAVWEQESGGQAVAQVAQYAEASGWTLGPSVSDPSAGAVDNPAVAVDESGNATAVWCQENGGLATTWSARFEAGAWQAAQRIEQTSTAVDCQARIVLDDAGDGTALWIAQSASGGVSFHFNRYE